MSGHTYNERHPIEACPYCDSMCDADWVDVGVGYVQCGPFHCQQCGASEIGGHDEPRELSDREKSTGWYAPNSEPGSSANVIGGKIVSAEVMRAEYRREFVDNPAYEEPGAVENWFADMRKAS